MPLVRLIAEGVGPFERLDIDLSDGKGKPHLGPHIFAGVNGSGKSTVLKTLAWVMDCGNAGFQHDDWQHLLNGHTRSRALAVLRPPFESSLRIAACTRGILGQDWRDFTAWIRSALSDYGLDEGDLSALKGGDPLDAWTVASISANASWLLFPRFHASPAWSNLAAYAPSKVLKYLASPDVAKTSSEGPEKSLAFESTVQNEAIQAWLLSLFSRRAIARERHQSGEEYTRSLGRFEKALQLIYGESVSFEVEIEPRFQPRLKVLGRSLNFSQLPDGVRSTVAWIADFMMRQDLFKWDPRLNGKRPGILLLDEVDAHLHPLWQRRLLPASREVLPDVQILVTSHSPFVISSCPNSRVHVLELDQDGHAHARPPVDSPIGESVTTTLKEIFDVDSRFDVLTEKQLDEWNTLKKREATSSLSAADKSRLKKLTETLAERSEELRSIVASPLTIPQSVLRSLTAAGTKPQQIKRKKRA
jgi:energy-coupling factor transporter ATP-binding protein EcfA2